MKRALSVLTAVTRRSSSGPTTRLGRWCTPQYAETCSPELKADLNSRDNSVETADMRLEKTTRPPAASACPWSEPTWCLALDSYGR